MKNNLNGGGMRAILSVLVLVFLLSACGKSDEELYIITEDSYNQGYYDALDCVNRKGGAASSAAKDCEDE